MRVFLVSFCLLIFFSKCYASSFADIKNWNDPQITYQLKNEKIVSKTPMQDFLRSEGKRADFEGKVFLVVLGNALKAVFKSLPQEDLGDAYAEVVAYEASQVLGFPYVPPTDVPLAKVLHPKEALSFS